jgi:AraC-like DNA-binding protein
VVLTEVPLLPVNIIQILSVFTCLLAVAMLHGEKRYTGVVLAFSVHALVMLFNLLEELRLTTNLMLVTPALSLTSGPALYLFIRILLKPDRPMSMSDIWHFSLACIALFFTHHITVVLAVGALSQLTYLAVSLHMLIRYKRAIQERRSDPERLELSWLFRLLFILSFIIVAEVIRVNLQPYLPYQIRNQWYFTDQVVLLLLLTGLIVGLVRQSEVFSGLSEFEQNEKAPAPDSHDQAQSIFSELDETIKQAQLFRTPRLALQDLANHTGLSVKDISWAINQGGRMSFADYINGLRINEVIQGAQASDRRALLDIALDAGFSSKSSFNAAFKKHTGLSPTQYLKGPES